MISHHCTRYSLWVVLLVSSALFAVAPQASASSVAQVALEGRATWIERDVATGQRLVYLDAEYHWTTEAGESHLEIHEAPELLVLHESGSVLHKISLQEIDEPDPFVLFFPADRTLVFLGMAQAGKAWLLDLDSQKLSSLPAGITSASANLKAGHLMIGRRNVLEVFDVGTGERIKSKVLQHPALQILADESGNVLLLDEKGSLQVTHGPDYQDWEAWNPGVEIASLEYMEPTSGRLIFTGWSSTQSQVPSLMSYTPGESGARTFKPEVRSPQILPSQIADSGIFVLDQENEILHQFESGSLEAQHSRKMRNQPGWLHSLGNTGEALLIGNNHIALSWPDAELQLLAHFEQEVLALDIDWESGRLDCLLSEEGIQPGTKVRSKLLTLELPKTPKSLDSTPVQHVSSPTASLPAVQRRTL